MNRTFRNVAIAIAAIFSIHLASSASAQTIQADYQVQGTLASSVPSGIGPLVPVGGVSTPTYTTTTVNGNPQQVLQIVSSNPAMGTPILSGVQVMTNPFVSDSNFSIVLLGSFDLTTTGVLSTKVFDFKNLSSDAGLYINTMTGNLEFVNASGVIVGTGVPGANVTTNTYVQIALTRDSTTQLVSVYETNPLGVTTLAFSFTDTTGLAVLGDATNTGNQFLTLYKDEGMGAGGTVLNEGSQGNIARLRLYNGVLSASQIMALDTTVVPEPSTWALLGLGAGVLLLGLRRRAVNGRRF